MSEILLILHNIRSAFNVGSILRSAEGFGVKKIICSGYTPYPKIENDSRLPHIYKKLTSQIHKSSLGAENFLDIKHVSELDFNKLKAEGYKIIALEQNKSSVKIKDFEAPSKIALLLGEEVHGVSKDHLVLCDKIVEIPMHGKKESFNVAVACAIALYSIVT